MLYNNFLHNPHIIQLLNELRERAKIEQDEKIKEIEGTMGGEENAYTFTVPLQVLEQAVDIQKNIDAIFTNNNMLTISLMKYMEVAENNIVETFGEFLEKINGDTVKNMLEIVLTSTSKDFRDEFFKTWLMVDDLHYCGEDFVKIVKMLPLHDLKIFLINLSIVKHDEDYIRALFDIYKNYYANFYRECDDNVESLRNVLDAGSLYHGITPFYLTLYTGWRECHPHAPLQEFFKYLTSFEYDETIDSFHFIDEDALVAFKRIMDDDVLTAGLYFQLFDYMIKNYGDEYFQNYHYDPYDCYNNAVVINLQDFKNHYIENAPMEWIVSLCGVITETFDDSPRMFYKK